LNPRAAPKSSQPDREDESEAAGQNVNASAKALGIEVFQDCAYYRPAGRVNLDEAVELVDKAITYAREQRIPKLFVNAVGLTGFPSPSLPERYFLARKFAATAQGAVQLALVIRPEIIDPERFGIIVARNAGMNADVFTNERDALAWLNGPGR
jgi:hypothetical protein